VREKLLRTIRSIAYVLSVVFLLTSGTSLVTHAAVPIANGTIFGCYNKLTNALRVYDSEAGGSCNTLLENNITWNQPQGPRGQAHVLYDDSTGVYTLDAARSVNVTSMVASPVGIGVCLTVNFTPKSVQATVDQYGGYFTTLSYKDANGWSNPDGGGYCGGSQNIAAISTGAGFLLAIY